MIIDELARYAASDQQRGLPPEVIHFAKRALVDWFSALFPGTQVAPATHLIQAYASELGSGKSSLPGFATTAFPGTAAWINGSASHAVEFDDIFRDAIYHPGCPTIAAALAIAEDISASGRDFLTAITLGYEISTRIGAAIQPSHYKFFHTTGTVGCFGGAAAAAALLAPARQEVMAHSLATAASFAAGLQQAFRSEAMTKALHAGHAAWVGVNAGKSAASGVTGALDILEGDAGLGFALSDDPQWHRATEGLGERYNILSITQKNHGCCGHTFAPIDAALALRKQFGFQPEDIEAITVHTAQIPINVAGNPNPRTAFEAKFSIPYVVSHALHYGAVRLNAFDEARLTDPGIRALMRRISLIGDPEMSARFPSMRAARVVINLLDGRVVEHFQPYRKGDPEAPLTDEELNDKFHELVAPVIGDGAARRLLAQLWQMEQLQVADLGLAGLRKQ